MNHFHDQFQVSLKGVFLFEMKSFIGRTFFNSKPQLRDDQPNFLNLGCSSTIIDNWTNADFYDLRSLLSLKSGKSFSQPNWFVDLRYPLNCDNDVWDGIFTEHTLEHLYPTQALKLIDELFRTMKSGAWLRITVPDLNKYVNFYKGEEVDKEFNFRWKTGCEAMRSLTQDYYHSSLWNSELLSRCLEDSRFINVLNIFNT
jgi:predicted SAM-dependent methyltransferase